MLNHHDVGVTTRKRPHQDTWNLYQIVLMKTSLTLDSATLHP